MKKLFAFGAIALGGAIALRYLSRQTNRHLGEVVGRRIMKRMEHMMASLPDDAPPKLIMSVLPRLQAQNDQILALLREQNELLRQHQRAA